MDDLIFAPANLGIRQRSVCKALEDAGGELSFPALREAVPDLCRQDVWNAVSYFEKRGLVDVGYDEDGVKHIRYTYRERVLEDLMKRMQEASEDDYPGRFDYLPDPEEEPAGEDQEDDQDEEEMTPEQIREEVRDALSESRTKSPEEMSAETRRETDENADLYRKQARRLWEGMDPDNPEESMTTPGNL